MSGHACETRKEKKKKHSDRVLKKKGTDPWTSRKGVEPPNAVLHHHTHHIASHRPSAGPCHSCWPPFLSGTG